MAKTLKFSRFAFLKETAEMAVSNVLRNRMRSFLTMLGIIIGVASVVALISIVSGVSDEMMSQFDSLGTGTLSISATGHALKPGLSESDIMEISSLDNVAGVSPSITSTIDARSGNGLAENISLEGRSSAYFERNNDILTEGRSINRLDVEGENRVCLIDETLKKKLFPAGDAVGKTIQLGSSTYTVIGVTGESSDVMAQMAGDGDGKVTIPYATAMKLTGNRRITSLEVYQQDANRTDETIEALEGKLDAAFNGKEDSYSIINMQSLLDMMDTMLGLMTTLLAGIAAISLVVGGIGIMNMMLVSVTERTTEIGLRKALGAEPYQIQIQFLIESILLSLCGGLIGLLLSVIITVAFASFAGIGSTVTASSVALGLGFSAAIGVAFGWAPARKASNLNPIDALRSV